MFFADNELFLISIEMDVWDNIVLRGSLSRNCLTLFKRPIYLARMVYLWSFHVICPSSISPRNFIEDFISINLLEMWRPVIFRGILSLTEFLWEKVYLFFFIFNDNLFTVNQPPSFYRSSFTVEKSVLIS